jgi:hypothetical protein
MVGDGSWLRRRRSLFATVLAQPDAGAVAVLVDEDHTGGLERGAARGPFVADWVELPFSKSATTWREATARRASSALIHPDEAAGGAALRPARSA